jgi:hypothetical protein
MAIVTIFIEIDTDTPVEAITSAYNDIPREFNIVGQTIDDVPVDEEGDPI